jgi:hypothetical protein
MYNGSQNPFATKQNYVNDWPRCSRNFLNIQGVEVPHGPQEYGKDIVFYSQDAIGDWILNACVVKNAKITAQPKARIQLATSLIRLNSTGHSIHQQIR